MRPSLRVGFLMRSRMKWGVGASGVRLGAAHHPRGNSDFRLTPGLGGCNDVYMDISPTPHGPHVYGIEAYSLTPPIVRVTHGVKYINMDEAFIDAQALIAMGYGADVVVVH